MAWTRVPVGSAGRSSQGGGRENSLPSLALPGQLPASFVTSSVRRAYSSQCAAGSAGDDVGAAEEGADFCAVQMTGYCLITFDGHNSVDVNRAVGDLTRTGHLGW